MNKYNYIQISDARRLIEDEITAAKGAESLSGILDFLTTKDVNDLVQGLLKRKERQNNCTVLNLLVQPINDPVEGFKAGGYDYVSYLRPELLKLNFEDKPRLISIVVPDETVKSDTVTEYLFKLRKKPLANPVNYLLGLGKAFKNDTIPFPESLLRCEIVAFPEKHADLLKYPGHEGEEPALNSQYAVAIKKRDDDKEEKFGIMRVIAGPGIFHSHTAFLCEDL